MFYIIHLQVEHTHVEAWERYMREQHIQEVVDTGCFTRAWMMRDEDRDEDNWRGWRCMYQLKSQEAYERYKEQFASDLQRDHVEKFGAHVKANREILPIDSEYIPRHEEAKVHP